jgi:hypothetical protein
MENIQNRPDVQDSIAKIEQGIAELREAMALDQRDAGEWLDEKETREEGNWCTNTLSSALAAVKDELRVCCYEL